MTAIKQLKYIAFLSLLCVSLSVSAQNVMTSSPYSMYGIGELSNGLYGANASMGGLSTGMRNEWLINTDNPAGLSGLDTTRLYAEVSAFSKFENYKSKGTGSNAFTGNLSRFALAGRLMPHWYMAVGLTPYSFAGYYFVSTQEIEGSPGTYANSVFSGDGGLSKFYMTNAITLGKHLSIGGNVNFIFGNMTNAETQSDMAVNKTINGRTVSGDFGLQYYRRLSKTSFLTIGATYGMQQGITLKRTKTIIKSSTSTDYSMRSVHQTLPQFAGLGMSLVKGKMTYGADYTFRQYSKLKSDESSVSFKDSHSLKLGVCYFPNGYSSMSLWQRVAYKAGVIVSTPYMSVNGKNGYSVRATAGLDFPVMFGKVNLALFYDHMQLQDNVLQRNLTGLTVTFTLSEYFYKVKL